MTRYLHLDLNDNLGLKSKYTSIVLIQFYCQAKIQGLFHLGCFNQSNNPYLYFLNLFHLIPENCQICAMIVVVVFTFAHWTMTLIVFDKNI